MAFQIVKILDLPVAASIADTDQFPVETTAGTKRVTQSVINTYLGTGKFLRKNVNETTSGTITAAGFSTASSRKYKENIQPLDVEHIERVLKLTPVSYDFKKDSPIKPGQSDIGLIAEDVKDHVPELVNTDENGNLSVDYSKLSVYLLLVIKNLLAE